MLAVKKLGQNHVSLIGVSVTGAIFHNIGQLTVASWIAKTWTVFLYLPILSFIGILAGVATGIMANYLITHVEKLNYYFYLRNVHGNVDGKGERDETSSNMGRLS